jgi:spermidine/putrescine transport system ATP-binding protein
MAELPVAEAQHSPRGDNGPLAPVAELRAAGVQRDPNAASTAVIALEKISRRYGSVSAVDDLSLAIAPGEFFSLLGASGCGKTTTLRIIAGFERPDSGRVRLMGLDVTEAPAHRRPVNTVFQNYALFPHLNVWDNVAFGPRSCRLPRSEIRRRVGEALDVVRLSDLAKRLPRQLSGGQQQRVALARALVNKPAALLLDEPLAALDPSLRQAMQAELKRIQREVGITFLLVTHDREEALALSDRLAVLHHGCLEQLGTPRQLYDEPSSAYVAAFLGGANLLPDLARGRWRLLRPERLGLSAAPPAAGRLGLRARVVEVRFQGPTLAVRLQPLEPGPVGPIGSTDLKATAARDNLPGDLIHGVELWCHWDPADTHLLCDPIR